MLQVGSYLVGRGPRKQNLVISLDSSLDENTGLGLSDDFFNQLEIDQPELGTSRAVAIALARTSIAAEKAKTIITMLPAGIQVRQVYLEGNASFLQAPADKDRLLLECSTIEVNTAKEIGRMVLEAGKGTYIDAPVSVSSHT